MQDVVEGATEVDVEEGVEDPVEGEVERLQNVGRLDGRQQRGVIDAGYQLIVSKRRQQQRLQSEAAGDRRLHAEAAYRVVRR